MVKIVLDIPEKSFERLSKLSEHYKKEVPEVISDFITVLDAYVLHMIRLSEEYIAPYPLTAILHHIMDSGIHSTDSIYNKILDLLGAKGRFIQTDLETDIEDLRLWVNFDALVGSDFLIDNFDINIKSGIVELIAQYIMDKDEINKKIINKLIKIIDVNDMEEKIEIPEGFYNTESYRFTLEDDGEMVVLHLDVIAESLFYLPSIPDIDSLYDNLLKEAGIF